MKINESKPNYLVSHFDDTNLIRFLTATHTFIGRRVQYIVLNIRSMSRVCWVLIYWWGLKLSDFDNVVLVIVIVIVIIIMIAQLKKNVNSRILKSPKMRNLRKFKHAKITRSTV